MPKYFISIIILSVHNNSIKLLSNITTLFPNSYDSERTDSWGRALVTPGLEITAGQRTMSGLIGELTSQLFVLPVMLTSHNRSYWKWNQLFQLLSVCSESLCIAKRWSEILGEIQLQPLFTIRALKQTLGFTHFRSQNLKYFYFSELSNNLRASDRSRRKKSGFAGFLERFAETSADIAGISRNFRD